MDFLRFKIELLNDITKTPRIFVTQVIINETIYIFPDEVQDAQLHNVLKKRQPFTKASKDLERKGILNTYRKFQCRIDKDLQDEYFDQDENPEFRNFLLRDLDETIDASSNEKRSSVEHLLGLFKDTVLKEKKFKSYMAEKEFNVKKFDGKSNVQEFTSQLEIEFTRHDIVEDMQKIEILRFMVTGNIIDWYEESKSKLSMHDWNAWKVSLIETYGVINYARVRSVFEFNYMGGRLVDYAIKKGTSHSRIRSVNT